MMDFKELQSRLNEVGVVVPDGTLRRWAADGLITGPAKYKKLREGSKNRYRRGRFMSWPDKAVYEAAACWAVKNLDPIGIYVPKETIKRIKTLADEFFKNVDAVDWRQDYAPDGTPNMYFSSYDIHPLFVTYVAAYEKAFDKRRMDQQIQVKYHVMTKLNCSKNDDSKRFYPVVGVELEKIDKDCDILTWDHVEPWQYLDPDTGKPYEIIRDENGCSKFVKQPLPEQRFLSHIISKST
jgi:hypothetical protein